MMPRGKPKKKVKKQGEALALVLEYIKQVRKNRIATVATILKTRKF
jgi:hypothetical protein